MAEWTENIYNILSYGRMDEVCILKLDYSAWIALPRDFLLSHYEVTYLIRLFEQRSEGITIALIGQEYELISNYGIGLHCENQTKVMYIAKTNFHLILGTRSVKDERIYPSCETEIDRIRTKLDIEDLF